MAHEIPPYSLKILRMRNVVDISVTLHKIPQQYIDTDLTSTHFHLNTLKYSKKFNLDIDFPDNIVVDDSKLEAELISGVFKLRLPILSSNLAPIAKPESRKKRKLEALKSIKDDSKKIDLQKDNKTEDATVEADQAQPSLKKVKKSKKPFVTADAANMIIDSVNAIEEKKIDKQTKEENFKRMVQAEVRIKKDESKKAKKELKDKLKDVMAEKLVEKVEHEKNAPRPIKKKTSK